MLKYENTLLYKQRERETPTTIKDKNTCGQHLVSPVEAPGDKNVVVNENELVVHETSLSPDHNLHSTSPHSRHLTSRNSHTARLYY